MDNLDQWMKSENDGDDDGGDAIAVAVAGERKMEECDWKRLELIHFHFADDVMEIRMKWINPFVFAVLYIIHMKHETWNM